MHGSPALRDTVKPALTKQTPNPATSCWRYGTHCLLGVHCCHIGCTTAVQSCSVTSSAIQQTACLLSSLAGAGTTPACEWDHMRQMTEHTPSQQQPIQTAIPAARTPKPTTAKPKPPILLLTKVPQHAGHVCCIQGESTQTSTNTIRSGNRFLGSCCDTQELVGLQDHPENVCTHTPHHNTL